MSLVGPRPEASVLHASYVEHTPAYVYRNMVRPGITGWAQVSNAPSSNPDEARRKLRYDLFYVKRGSAMLDFLILARTIGALMRSPEAARRAAPSISGSAAFAPRTAGGGPAYSPPDL